MLLEHGASVDSNADSPDEFAVKGTNPIFETPLPLAASYGEDDVIRVLLKHGADIDQRFGLPRNNGTALFEAVYAEDLSTVYLLLTHGASIKAAFGPADTIPPVLLQPDMDSRNVALRNLLTRYGARMPPRR